MKEIKVILGKFPLSLSFDIGYLPLQCFLMFCQLPYIDSIKCEELIQQMKKGARVVLTIARLLNIPTSIVIHAPVKVIKILTQSSPLNLLWSKEEVSTLE